MKLKKIIVLTLIFVMAMSTASFAATMYAPDGRTINVYDWEVGAYQNVGWYTSPVVTVYAPDGRSCVIYDYEVSAWESVGWIDGRKTSTIYAPDGRTATVPTWQLQSYLNVGWYTYPVYSSTQSYAPSTSGQYFPGTIVPDYTYVTGVSQKLSPYYADNGYVVYIYEDVKYGEYSEVVDYMSYLRQCGWTLAETDDSDVGSITWFYQKNGKVVGVTFNAKYDEVWITV